MKKFSVQLDPLTGEKYIEVPFKGHPVVDNPIYNKGSAFTEQERELLNLYGILPDQVSNIKDQTRRAYENYSRKQSPVEKYIYLLSLLDRNETLFYHLFLKNIEEMLPIIYTPTVGEAAKTFSLLFRRPRGLYVSSQKITFIDRILSNAPFSNIKLIVVTDGERILGLGDQGVGGMAIPIGKTCLYVVGGGLHPALCLPILLDVGTDNEELLKDPLYLGLKHRRLKGQEYDAVVEEFVKGIKRCFPHAVLQWEDFGKHNARRLLMRYRERICSFDDDIQGTGAVALAFLYNAMRLKKETLAQQNYLIFGLGQAGYGVGQTIISALVDQGLTPEQAKKKIYAIDRDGLLLENMKLDEYQKPFAHKIEEISSWHLKNKNHIGLLDTIENAKITVLIGTSGVTDAFDVQALNQLAKNCSKPVILALSNPTSKSECTPDCALTASKGNCIIGTGSPFAPVEVNGRKQKIPQCNNMYIFPGLGLGASLSMTPKITDRMFIASARALAELVPDSELEQTIFPDINNIRKISAAVSFAVLKEARDSGLGIRKSDQELKKLIEHSMWEPRYLPYRYEGPNKEFD